MEDSCFEFVEILFPLNIPHTLTYRVDKSELPLVQKGVRVIAPIKNKSMIGIIYDTKINSSVKNPKYIKKILDKKCIFNELHLNFLLWIADYYMCNIGEVLQAALPKGFKLKKKISIKINPDASNIEKQEYIEEEEQKILEKIYENKSISLERLKKLPIINILVWIKKMEKKQWIIQEETIEEDYTPRKEKYISLSMIYFQDMETLFSLIKKESKQEIALIKYLSQIKKIKIFDDGKWIKKNDFIKENNALFSISTVNTLLKKEILIEKEREISQLKKDEITIEIKNNLNQKQQTALDQIRTLFKKKNTIYFHGITSSGKTEIYIHLIKEYVDKGFQVLVMVPEIVLTEQIVFRLQKVFGDILEVYHSRISKNKRVEIWHAVASHNCKIVLGVRSSIFLPFQKLGCIVIDEEYDNSYKQTQRKPRYHARNAALVLAQRHEAKVILGSATPCFESYYLAIKGKYGLVSLPDRYGGIQLPKIIIADLVKEKREKKLYDNISSELYQHIKESLNKKEQVLLFQNRKGYAPILYCSACKESIFCKNCSVTMTFHKSKQILHCHYCGYTHPIPPHCPHCYATELKLKGFGIEKIEEQLSNLFPEAKIQRLDANIANNRNRIQDILQSFERGEIDIMVGTQIIAKGLDFEKVNVVGVFDIDRMVYYPDFRAHEHSYQLLTQIIGRAGRRKKGTIIIQTENPKHKLLSQWIVQPYCNFYDSEIGIRKKFDYPPFYRIIKIELLSSFSRNLDIQSKKLVNILQKIVEKRNILGPETPLIEKVNSKYRKHILIKVKRENTEEYMNTKKKLKELTAILKTKSIHDIEVVFDADF